MKNQITLQCKIIAYNFSPTGGVEGLLVEALGKFTQIVFAHDKGTELARDLSLGETVDLIVASKAPSPKGKAEHPVYQFISMAQVGKSGDLSDRSSSEATGLVSRVNYARHGQANGVVLDSGDFIHLKPDGMRQITLRVGDQVEAKGKARRMELGGRVIEAKSINGVRLIDERG